MIKHTYIGPGRQGNYLAGYYKPGTRVFVSMMDCNTEKQAQEAVALLDKESKQRDMAALPLVMTDRRVISEFYLED